MINRNTADNRFVETVNGVVRPVEPHPIKIALLTGTENLQICLYLFITRVLQASSQASVPPGSVTCP